MTDRRDSKRATGEVKQGSASDGQIRPELTQFVTVQKKTWSHNRRKGHEIRVGQFSRLNKALATQNLPHNYILMSSILFFLRVS